MRAKKPFKQKPGVEILEDRCVPAGNVLTVTTLADMHVAGKLTLREALASATSGDLINFQSGLSGALTLNTANGSLADNVNVTIQGPGSSAITLQGPAANSFTLLQVAPAVTGTVISGLDFAGGVGTSGGNGLDAGAIYNQGGLTLLNSNLSGNTGGPSGSHFGGYGGTIFNASGANLTLISCTLTGNTSVYSAAYGGAIYNSANATANLTATTLSGFRAYNEGGGIYNNASGTVTLTGCTITGTPGYFLATDGGGIFNRGKAYLSSSTIQNCQASKEGGDIYNDTGARLVVTGSTVSGSLGLITNGYNFYGYFLADNGGGLYNRGDATLNNSTIKACGALYNGGGIFNDTTGTLSITGSTISGNVTDRYANVKTYGGGIDNLGDLTITNSTIWGNVALGAYSNGYIIPTQRSYGGGISNHGKLTITNATITANSAETGGGLFIDPANTRTTISNTIIARNTLIQTGHFPDVAGPVKSAVNDLIGDGTGSSGFGAGNLVGNFAAPIDPVLSPLQDNGGPTQTLAELPGSPALGAGSVAAAMAANLTTDQRGLPRFRNGSVDIGAFESRGFVLTITSGSGQQALVNTAFAAPLVVTVSSPFGEPVAGGSVTFSAPSSGPSASLSAGTVRIVGNQASVTATANGLPGSYGVTVATPGASPAAFTLTNTLAPPPPVVGTVVAGADAGGGPQVTVFNPDGSVRASFFAFAPGFTGGVRVAVGDVNGDGVADIICSAGPGGGPQVTVFDGRTLQPLLSFFAFPAGFTGGVYVASGDVNGDGQADVVCSAGPGGGPQVAVYSGKDASLLVSFYAFSSSFTGGVRVAAGDVNGDGKADVIAAAGPGGGPQVVVFDASRQLILASFYAMSASFTGGVYVASGDVNGDGQADVICGAGAGGGPQVTVFDGRNQSLLASFFAFNPSFTGGVRVGYAAGSRPEIIAGAGPGGGPQLTAFDAVTLQALNSLFAYNPSFTGGLFVGGG